MKLIIKDRAQMQRPQSIITELEFNGLLIIQF